MPQLLGSSIYQHIRRQDVAVFRDAARRFQVHILVRRTNPASLQYIGRKGYIPKPIDCKPKTADTNVLLPTGMIVRCAGLVVNPLLPGFDKAFESTEKLNKAKDEWQKFDAKHGVGNDRLSSGEAMVQGASLEKIGGHYYYTLDRGGVFLLQDDREHQHFGCLYFCLLNLQGVFPKDAKAALQPLSARATNSYLHGDYDLYAIVPADMPQFKTVEQAQVFGTQNLYTEKTREIAEFINRGIGAQMIQHGASENDPRQKGHADDHLDVFWVNGDITEAKGADAIRKLYEQEFRGRNTGAQSSRPGFR